MEPAMLCGSSVELCTKNTANVGLVAQLTASKGRPPGSHPGYRDQDPGGDKASVYLHQHFIISLHGPIHARVLHQAERDQPIRG